jgi:hypothetical protein
LTNAWQAFELIFTPSANENVMWNADLAAQLGTVCFDDFTFARSALLPIELLDFKGFAEKQGNRLTWTLADTKDLAGVEAEQSKDGLNFTPLPKEQESAISIKAPSTTSGGLETSKTFIAFDNTPFNLTYYRLKMTETDGKTSFSKTIAIHRENTEGSKSKLKVHPNPVSHILTIETTEQGDFQIINLLGQTLIKGKTTQQMDVSALPKGTYFLKIGTNQTKFVKQ